MKFIIYDDDSALVEGYKEVIFHVMNSSKLNYSYCIFSNYDEALKKEIHDIGSNKIYIINVDTLGENGFDLAMNIRKSGDLNNPVIAISSDKSYKIVGFISKMFLLDFISNDNEIFNNLKDIIKVSLKHVMSKKNLSFHYKGESYLIPYDEILYIEKVLNDNSSLIVTNNDIISIPRSISYLENELDKDIFIKTHRSCLVNIKKIKHIDFDNRIILVGNRRIDLLSRNNKKMVKLLFDNYCNH